MNFLKKRITIVVSVLLLIIVVAGYFYFRNSSNKTSEETSYEQVPASMRNLSITILSTGEVQPENKLDIKPPVAGRVERILVKQGDKVKKGQILAWMSSTERAAMLDAASAKGSEEVKKWEDLYRPTPIMAPINGTIIQRNVEAGQTFTTADAVFVMSDRLTVEASVDETDIAKIKLKQKAKIILDAYSNVEIEGHVNQIAYDATTVNNVTTYAVDVLPSQVPEFMRSGMTANVTFYVESKEESLCVPSDAIKVENGKMVVLVDDNGKGIRSKEVDVGASDGKYTEILSGLSSGEIVLVESFKGLSERSENKSGSPFSPMRRMRSKKK